MTEERRKGERRIVSSGDAYRKHKEIGWRERLHGPDRRAPQSAQKLELKPSELSARWRVSKSGFTIRCGQEGDKRWIAKYPYAVIGPEFSNKEFEKWLELAEYICALHNQNVDKEST